MRTPNTQGASNLLRNLVHVSLNSYQVFDAETQGRKGRREFVYPLRPLRLCALASKNWPITISEFKG